MWICNTLYRDAMLFLATHLKDQVKVNWRILGMVPVTLS